MLKRWITAWPLSALLVWLAAWLVYTALLGLGRDALTRRDRADSRKSQQRLREMLEIIGLVRDWAGSDLAAMSWYRATPVPAFGGRTAEAIVKDGNAHLVREYIDHLALGGYA